MIDKVVLTEVTDAVTPEEETYPPNYNFAMESIWDGTEFSPGGGTTPKSATVTMAGNLHSKEMGDALAAASGFEDYVFFLVSDLPTPPSKPPAIETLPIFGIRLVNFVDPKPSDPYETPWGITYGQRTATTGTVGYTTTMFGMANTGSTYKVSGLTYKLYEIGLAQEVSNV